MVGDIATVASARVPGLGAEKGSRGSLAPDSAHSCRIAKIGAM